MDTTSIFLGSKGLSQSEANHTANVAKELAQDIALEIAQMSTHKRMLHDGFGTVPYTHVRTCPDLEKKCLSEGMIYALSAWLREGIKAKAEIIRSIQTASTEDLGFTMPEAPEHPELKRAPSTEAEMISELSIAERAEYLSVESMAAHIGKKIHPGGIIPGWRSALANTPPVEMIQGEKAYMRVDVQSVIDPKEIDNLFYKLQREHREAESRLNYYKAKLHNLFNEKVGAIQSENAIALNKYRAEHMDYTNAVQVIGREGEAKRAALLKEVSDLKIIVPDSLQTTLDSVLAVSKK